MIDTEIDPRTWNSWLAHRKALGKPLTPAQARILHHRLTQLLPTHDVNRAILWSIEKGWENVLKKGWNNSRWLYTGKDYIDTPTRKGDDFRLDAFFNYLGGFGK